MARVDRLIGVYDADGSLLGELAYVVGHALGRRSCALCDITHGRLRRKAEFDEVAARLPVPLDLLHRDAQPPTLAAATAGRLPCVVAERGGNLTLLVGPDTLAGCGGDPTALLDAVRSAAAAHGLELDAA
ncbi:MAG: hypothetical protein ACRDYW_09130 [Acidimicrobiales bacterium]